MGFYDFVIIGATALMCILLKLGSKSDVKTDSTTTRDSSDDDDKEQKRKTGRKNK